MLSARWTSHRWHFVHCGTGDSDKDVLDKDVLIELENIRIAYILETTRKSRVPGSQTKNATRPLNEGIVLATVALTPHLK